MFYSNKIGDNCWRPRECVSNTQQWMAGSISMAHYTMHSDIQVHALWYTCSILGHILVYLCSQFCLVSMLDGTEYLHHDNSIDMILVLGSQESPHV